uniref:Uncharacterized protein n=1 Tax=Oryza brachyantha TaxID=4533 RepID=J3ME26_ORYBR
MAASAQPEKDLPLNTWHTSANMEQNLAMMNKVRLIPGKELFVCRCGLHEMTQVNELLNLIDNLKSVGLTVVFASWNLIWRRIQPLKDRVRYAFEYLGGDDLTQESNEVLRKDVITSRTLRLFQPGTFIPTSHRISRCPITHGITTPGQAFSNTILCFYIPKKVLQWSIGKHRQTVTIDYVTIVYSIVTH